MQNIQYYPSITNIQLRIEANTLPELFKAGISGMASLLKEKAEWPAPAITRVIEVKSADKTFLLVDFLERVRVLSQAERAVFCHISEIVMHNNFVKAKIQGFLADAFDADLVQVSFLEKKISKSPKNRWEAHLSFDHKTSLYSLN